MSTLEPFLFAADQARVFEESKKLYERALADPAAPARVREEAPAMIELSARQIENIEKRLTQLLSHSRDRLPAARSDLYFPGQEQMR
jgi:hypothetical protein